MKSNYKQNYIVIFLMIIGSIMAAAPAEAVLTTTDMNGGVTPTDMVNKLLGSGVSVSNISFNGAPDAGGIFSGGTGIIGFEDGIILSTGNIATVIGPNDQDGATTNNSMPGDPDLQALIPGYTTFDAATLEFDFIPSTNVITFNYVFGSEEYSEWVNSPYNNVFGFFLNGQNIALIPGTKTPVSINNVNGGNPCGSFSPNASNSTYFINNEVRDINCSFQPNAAPLNTQLDGLTVALTATAHVNPGVKNHIKLGISDAGDSVLDSDVFIRSGSFKAPRLTLTPLTSTNPRGSSHMLTARLVDSNGTPVAGQTITFTVTGPNAQSGVNVTDSNGNATFSYKGNLEGTDKIVATGAGENSNDAYKEWEKEEVPIPPVPEKNTVILSLTGLFALMLVSRKYRRG